MVLHHVILYSSVLSHDVPVCDLTPCRWLRFDDDYRPAHVLTFTTTSLPQKYTVNGNRLDM